MVDILTIAGSPSATSKSSAVLASIREYALGQGLSVDSLTVRDFDAEDLLFGRFESHSVIAAKSRIQSARVVVIATPVYKAAYSGALKAILDVLPQEALANKVVLPIATGGSLAHLLTIDYALNPVLSALGAGKILNGVFITDAQFLASNPLTLVTDADTRLKNAIADLLTALHKTPLVPNEVS